MVINQVNKDWDCAKETMDAYYAKVRKLESTSMGWNSTMWCVISMLRLMS